MDSQKEKLKGMFAGAIIGDYLGTRIEFLDKSQINKKYGDADKYLTQVKEEGSRISDETILLEHGIEFFSNPTDTYENHLGKLANHNDLQKKGFSEKMRNLFHHYHSFSEDNPHKHNSGAGYLPLMLPSLATIDSEEELKSLIEHYVPKSHTEYDRTWTQNYFSSLYHLIQNKPLIQAFENLNQEENDVISGNIEKRYDITGNSSDILPTSIMLYLASKQDLEQMVRTSIQQFDSADHDTLFFATGALIGASQGYSELPKEYWEIIPQYEEIEEKIDQFLSSYNDITIEPPDVEDITRLNEEELFTLIPELKPQIGYDSNQQRHVYSLWEHTLKTTEAVSEDYVLKNAALLHDVAKPFVRSDTGGKTTYHNHARCGERISHEILRRLDFSKNHKEEISKLIREHVINYSSEWSEKAIRRFKRRNGNVLDKLFELVEADNAAQAGRQSNLDELKRRLKNEIC